MLRSTKIRSVAVWSQQDLFLWNPACSSRILSSRESYIFSVVILQRTLFEIRRIMPLQFLHRVLVTSKRPSFQSWEVTSSFQMLLRREWRTLNETGPRSFQTSNFLVLQGFFKNFWTYAMVMCPVLMPNGGPSVRSGGPSGAGLHSRLYWKVSFNLLRWSSVLCRKVPFSSLPVCSGQFFAH